MELDLQKAIINNKQYYVVPEDIFSHLKLSEKEKKGLIKMEFGDNFYLVPILVTDEKPSSEEIDDFVSELFNSKSKNNNIDSREETSSSSDYCGKTYSYSGCGVTTEDPCGRNSRGCGYEPDPCGGPFWDRSSSC
jgi:hypothetical protein